MGEVIPHWLTKRAYLSPDSVAIETYDAGKITFLELQERSENFARKLASFGVKRKDRIALYFSNEIDFIVAIHAVSYIGAVAVLLNTRLTKREINYQLKDAMVSFLLVSDSLRDQVKSMNFSIPIKSFQEVEAVDEKNVSLQKEFSLQDPFTIVYTSGTTGNPKGVVHTYGNHWWSAIGSALNLGLSEGDKWLAVLPLFHVGGFSICIRSVVYGIPMFLMKHFEEERVNEVIFTREVTIASVVTVMLQRLYDELEDRSYPKSFRCMLLGGGPVPKPLLEKTRAKNIPVFQSYGLTETSSQIATLSPQDALRKLSSAGKPLFPGQLKIHSPDSTGVGEIWVKGPMVTKGYLNIDPMKTFKDGWLATGDLGYLDDDGFLYVVERRTDLIISGGENIYPSEIESVLSGHPDIQEVGVVGEPDEKWGEVPVAFIVPRTNNISKKAILHYAKKHLAGYKVPKRMILIEKLPRTASNKVMRQKLKKRLEKKT